MFNFKLQNRAFEELNAEQFRMIYFLNNTLSIVNEKHNTSDNDKVEMFNGYMMDKLGLSERQVQRLIKSLEDSGFISVERATRKKSPNIITINCDKNCDKNVTLNKKEIKNKNNKIYTSTCSNSTSMEKDNIKEKSNKKEMGIENNATIDEKDLFKDKDKSFWDFYNSLEDGYDLDKSQNEEDNKTIKENEMNDNGMNGMNANGNKVNTSTVVNEDRSTSTESIKIYTDTAVQTETEKKRESLLKNIEDGKRFMYEASKMKDLDGWCAQKDYLKIQFNNLKQITSPEAYKNETKKFNNWWDKTKHCFPSGYEKHISKNNQQPQKELEKNINPIDVRILQYWINEHKTNTQEQKDNAQNMIDTVLSEWSGKYDADSIVKVCQECHLKASGEHQTAKVEQLPTQHKTMQYKQQEEECGDFASEDLKIYYINTPSAQVAN